MYELGQLFIGKDGRRVKIVEILPTRTPHGRRLRYRLSGSSDYLSASQIAQRYERPLEPALAGASTR